MDEEYWHRHFVAISPRVAHSSSQSGLPCTPQNKTVFLYRRLLSQPCNSHAYPVIIERRAFLHSLIFSQTQLTTSHILSQMLHSFLMM